MSVGTRRHRVTLKKFTNSVGAGGRKTETEVDIATVSASIKASHHAPQVRGDKTEFPISHKITTHYSAAYLGARLITFGTRNFKVLSWTNIDERNKDLVFRCVEGKAG